MLDMNSINNNFSNSPDINMNYRDIIPPQTANNFYRQNREGNINIHSNEQIPSNLPKINKQNFILRKSQLNISSENIDNEYGNNDDHYQDNTKPKV
jgi:hypothetical protein